KTIQTDEAALRDTAEWCRAIGKTVVRTGDSTGFVVNRLLVPYMLDAIRVYEQGLASRDDIDNAMKLGCGTRWGHCSSPTTSASTPPTPSPRSCSTSSRKRASRRRHSSSAW